MLDIRGVYEVAIRVRDLARAETFYHEVLGLRMGLRDERRRWLFLRAGAAGMVVLQEDRGSWPVQHLAFQVDEFHLEEAAKRLQGAGVSVEGPVLHDWIPARSLYFWDPDGHELELCAPVEHAAAGARSEAPLAHDDAQQDLAQRHAELRPWWLKWLLLLIPASFLLWILIRIRVIAP